MAQVRAEEALAVATTVLESSGAPAEHARIQARGLVEADLRGHASHGLQRLPVIVERIRTGLIRPASIGHKRWLGPGVLEVHGDRGLGPVIALGTIDALAERVGAGGIALGVIRDSNHLGMLSLLAESIAARGLIGVVLTTSEALVHPYGGKMAMIGTNPVAIGIPTSPHPFILDMATGTTSMGRILDHANRAVAIPEGWAIDPNGIPTTDPVAASRGAITPFGGPKGFGLGLAIELIVGILTDSALGRDVTGTLDTLTACNKGDLLICIDPGVVGVEAAIARAGTYLDAIRSSPRQDGIDEILIPGDRSRRVRAGRLKDGIPLADSVWAEVSRLHIDSACGRS